MVAQGLGAVCQWETVVFSLYDDLFRGVLPCNVDVLVHAPCRFAVSLKNMTLLFAEMLL